MWSGTDPQRKLILIRHGMTRANSEQRYLGRGEEALSREGIEMLQRKKEQGLYPEPLRLFASPMKRCIETARILYPGKEAELITEWKEMDFGDFEGKNYKELCGNRDYQEWIQSQGTLPFPNGESRKEFLERCRAGLFKMWGRLEAEDSRIAAVVHGGTIMAVLSEFYGGEYFDYQVSNGSGYCCVLEGEMEKLHISEIRKLEELEK